MQLGTVSASQSPSWGGFQFGEDERIAVIPVIPSLPLGPWVPAGSAPFTTRGAVFSEPAAGREKGVKVLHMRTHTQTTLSHSGSYSFACFLS